VAQRTALLRGERQYALELATGQPKPTRSLRRGQPRPGLVQRCGIPATRILAVRWMRVVGRRPKTTASVDARPPQTQPSSAPRPRGRRVLPSPRDGHRSRATPRRSATPPTPTPPRPHADAVQRPTG